MWTCLYRPIVAALLLRLDLLLSPARSLLVKSAQGILLESSIPAGACFSYKDGEFLFLNIAMSQTRFCCMCVKYNYLLQRPRNVHCFHPWKLPSIPALQTHDSVEVSQVY